MIIKFPQFYPILLQKLPLNEYFFSKITFNLPNLYLNVFFLLKLLLACGNNISLDTDVAGIPRYLRAIWDNFKKILHEFQCDWHYQIITYFIDGCE